MAAMSKLKCQTALFVAYHIIYILASSGSCHVIVQNTTYYICEEQSVVFRQHVEETTREYHLYAQSTDVLKAQPAPSLPKCSGTILYSRVGSLSLAII